MLRGLVLAELQWLAVAASAGATGYAMAVYLCDWARRRTLPHPVSWLIWDLVYAVLVTALWLRGARWSLVPLALIPASNLVIAVLAVKRGTGQPGTGQKALMACCALALGAWCLVRDATAAAALAVSVELAAAVTIVAWIAATAATARRKPPSLETASPVARRPYQAKRCLDVLGKCRAAARRFPQLSWLGGIAA
jgi:hypothetical protein